jgi:transposase
VFYSIRSERLLMEQLEYNLLFRWFVGLNTDDPVWVPTVLTHNTGSLPTINTNFIKLAREEFAL